MYLKLVTPKSDIGMPLTIQEAKDFLRVSGAEEDALIVSLIKAATNKAQNITNRQLMRVTYQLVLDRLPSSIHLPRPPFAAITSITAIDDTGQEVVFEDESYTISGSDYATVYGVESSEWHSASYGKTVIEYEAGYESAAEIPEDIILAIQALITFFYANRGEVNRPVPEFIYNLLAPYRAYNV